MQTKISLMNSNIMVKATEREDETENKSGLIIPKETLEDEQVAQGVVIRSNSESVKIGDLLLFHKVMPVDVNMKIDKDEKLETYFFILEKDIICKIEK